MSPGGDADNPTVSVAFLKNASGVADRSEHQIHPQAGEWSRDPAHCEGIAVRNTGNRHGALPRACSEQFDIADRPQIPVPLSGSQFPIISVIGCLRVDVAWLLGLEDLAE